MRHHTFTITMQDLPPRGKRADRFIAAFLFSHGGDSPLVDFDQQAGTLTATFNVAAEDIDTAFHRGRHLIDRALYAIRVPARQITEVSVAHAEENILREPD